MKMLDERQKAKKYWAVNTLGLEEATLEEKNQAKKFLKDIGISDETVEKLEKGGKKKKKKEEEKVEESLDEVVILKGDARRNALTKKLFGKNDYYKLTPEEKKKVDNANVDKKVSHGFDEFKCANCGKKYIGSIQDPDNQCSSCAKKGLQRESCTGLNECNCQKCADDKHAKCNKPTKKSKKNEFGLEEEEIKDKINSPEAGEAFLKAKGINWDSVDVLPTGKVWKKNKQIVGAWDRSWGTVKTGNDVTTAPTTTATTAKVMA